MFDISEKDWKILRKKVPVWQENYMGKLIKEYKELLSSDNLNSEKFWALENRIWNDKKKTGVAIDMRRSRAIDNILNLIHEGAISQDDLDEFSDELKNTIKLICG